MLKNNWAHELGRIYSQVYAKNLVAQLRGRGVSLLLTMIRILMTTISKEIVIVFEVPCRIAHKIRLVLGLVW